MKTGGLISAATRMKRRLLSDTRGSMTIPGVILFTTLMAVGGLAIDMQRVYGVHGEMQAYVDDAALAAAAELDGQPGALSRAVRAACGMPCFESNGPLITGTQNFAEGPAALGIQKLTFLDRIDTDPSPIAKTPVGLDRVLCRYEAPSFAAVCLGGETVATASLKARFIEVVAAERTVSYLVLPIANAFGQVFGSGQLQASLRLRATAGFKKSVCDISPMMICNPSEPVGNTDPEAAYLPVIGQQILIRAGGGSSWAPGDFGWLNVAANTGVTDCLQGGFQDLGCMLGLVDPLTQCFNDDKVDVKPGQDNSTANGLNVRFDIYPNSNNLGPAHGVNTDARFAPSINVTKGICKLTPSGTITCDYSNQNARCPNPDSGGNSGFQLATGVTNTAARAVKMPRDQTWNGRFGAGDWDKLAYWKANHCPTCIALPSDFPATRYLMYRHEIECTLGTGTCFSGTGITDGIPNYSPSSDIGESGNRVAANGSKSCSNQAGVNLPNRDRRILLVAVVNCGAYGLHGNSVNNATAVAYLKVFLTEPVGFDAAGQWVGVANAKDVYGEVIEVIEPFDETNVVHIYPVLYR